MLPITQLLTPYNKNTKTSRTISYLVIHWVGAVSSAKNNAIYFKNNQLSSSAHYFVDEISIYQSVLDKDIAWHCGSAGTYYHPTCRNANSIGIEMCLDKTNHVSDQTIANTAELVQKLMRQYNISENNVIRHYDVTHKQCPAPYVTQAKWDKLKAILIGTKPSTNTPEKATTMIVNVKTSLNVRATYSTNAKIIGTLPPGAKVTVQKLGTKWARITYNGQKGYVYKKYLKNATAAAKTIIMTVNVKTSLNVRATYSTNAKVIGRLLPGTKVEVQKLGTKWARITYNGQKGYVYKKYLK